MARVVVIGGSAGALEPVRDIVASLPASFPAPVLVCLHLSPGSPSRLPKILDTAGPLAARHPAHGEGLEPGVVFVAPPDRHLIVNGDVVHLSRGPTENRHRPAVDTLFNSAARWYGPDVIGVVLSGALDDGAAGAAAIAAQDGTVIVQEPEEARVSAMPLAAAQAVRRALLTPVAQIASLLDRLTQAEPMPTPPPRPDPLLTWESDNVDPTSATAPAPIPGTPAALGCPDCHGGMFETTSPGGLPHYICHVGHSWSPESLMAAQRQASEAAHYAAAAKLLEEVTVLHRIAESRRNAGDTAEAQQLEEQAHRADQQAQHLQAMLRDRE